MANLAIESKVLTGRTNQCADNHLSDATDDPHPNGSLSKDLPPHSSCSNLAAVNRPTMVGIAAKTRNMTSEMTPGKVTKLARYSRRDNPRTHRTPAISAGANIASATRPIGIVEPRV